MTIIRMVGNWGGFKAWGFEGAVFPLGSFEQLAQSIWWHQVLYPVCFEAVLAGLPFLEICLRFDDFVVMKRVSNVDLVCSRSLHQPVANNQNGFCKAIVFAFDSLLRVCKKGFRLCMISISVFALLYFVSTLLKKDDRVCSYLQWVTWLNMGVATVHR